jgi:hypothetical protein
MFVCLFFLQVIRRLPAPVFVTQRHFYRFLSPRLTVRANLQSF